MKSTAKGALGNFLLILLYGRLQFNLKKGEPSSSPLENYAMLRASFSPLPMLGEGPGVRAVCQPRSI
jgi:hypothetical protein